MCQFVTNCVNLCAPLVRGHERQEVGKYFGSIVLDAHVHTMLPACVTGDNITYLLDGRMASLALGPSNKTLITPLLTSTLDT